MTIGLQFKLSTNATTFTEVSLLSTDFSAMNEARHSSHDPSLGKHALTRTFIVIGSRSLPSKSCRAENRYIVNINCSPGVKSCFIRADSLFSVQFVRLKLQQTAI